MDLSAADPDGTDVPVYDEDPGEAFTGPVNLGNFFAEESDVAELFTGDYDEDEYYDGPEPYDDGDGSYQPDPLVRSAAPVSYTHLTLQTKRIV